MDRATLQLAMLIGSLVSQLIPLLYKIDLSQLTPEEKVEWDDMIQRIKDAQELVTAYEKEPEV
jgi:hypothetical protein